MLLKYFVGHFIDFSFFFRVIETARRIPSRFSDKKAAVNFGYITCDELCDILASVGLRMDRKEVEILASGLKLPIYKCQLLRILMSAFP